MIILASIKLLFLLSLLKYLVAMATLNVRRVIMGKKKKKNWHLLLFHCRYFYKRFSEIFVEWSSTKHILFVLTSQFHWLSWQSKN